MNNFTSIFEELSKLYEEELPKKKLNRACNEELIKTTPTVKTYTKDEARAIIEANDALLAEYESLLPDYEDGRIDHGFEYGNFFNSTEDESKIVIQWVISDTDSTELIVDSLEAAIVAIRDIEASEGALVGTEIWRDEKLTEAAEAEEIEIVDDEVTAEEVPVEEPVMDEEPKQVICECDKCGALVIMDEAKMVIDEETDLVNVEDECKFCEEANGYKVIGVVTPYEVAEELPVDDEPEEAIEESVEVKENAEELEELLDFDVPVTITANDNEVAVGGLTSGN